MTLSQPTFLEGFLQERKKKSTFTTGTSEKRQSAAHPKASLVTHRAPDTQLNCSALVFQSVDAR